MFEFITTPPKGVFLSLSLSTALVGLAFCRLRWLRSRIYKEVKNALRGRIRQHEFILFSEFYDLIGTCAPKVNGRCKGRVLYLKCSPSETFGSVIGHLKKHLIETCGYRLESDTGAILGNQYEMCFAKGWSWYVIVVNRKVPQSQNAKMYSIHLK